MKVLMTNTKVNFKIFTTRKESFFLKWEGQLTVTEPITKQKLTDELMIDFISDINVPLHPRKKYRPEEVKVILTLA